MFEWLFGICLLFLVAGLFIHILVTDQLKTRVRFSEELLSRSKGREAACNEECHRLRERIGLLEEESSEQERLLSDIKTGKEARERKIANLEDQLRHARLDACSLQDSCAQLESTLKGERKQKERYRKEWDECKALVDAILDIVSEYNYERS